MTHRAEASSRSSVPGRPALLVFIRHAESARNIAKEDNRFFVDEEARAPVHGIPDWQVPLTPEGWRQARATGRRLRERFGTFDAVYHSGYCRAEETMRGLLEAYPADEQAHMIVEMSAFVRERDAGYTYDMTEGEARAAFPWLDPHWKTFGPWFSRPPGGESLADVSNRASLFLDAIFRDRAGARVLVVTHGGTLRAFRFLLERWTFDDTSADLATYRVPNCSINVYRQNQDSGLLELDGLNLVLADPD